MSKLLVIDNYDSFTYNLVQMFRRYNLEIDVYRSDKISVTQAGSINPDYILISPGPRDPAHAGVSINLVKAFYKKIPILGVCLGMQCINEAFGGSTVRAPVPMHGKTSLIPHNHSALFKGLVSPFKVARYHSLMVNINNSELVVSSRSKDGVAMGFSHKVYPVHGLQFHPESFLTENGFQIIENFLKLGPCTDVTSK
ncbi:anthranilate synthase component II [Desulfosarcina sp. BuS5]|uniref:anthranilate synthase component II n=1 Tax=Desulfosarcina sp. BuS5 TaxID=933262 RepID=UPI00055181A3|nr:aminodeoxychorismate/anthranilate synthase component II [Desulfosarcina sp. BuS5]WDN87401.1 anthranilate synthase component II [Desulfosarcina sp. BuS5]